MSNYNIGVDVHKIREEIGKLCADVRYWNSRKVNPMSVLERAVRVRHRLSWIHPFPNGNGRHARMMVDIYLYSHRHPLSIRPSFDISIEGNARARYFAALRRADGGDFRQLVNYTVQYLPKESKLQGKPD